MQNYKILFLNSSQEDNIIISSLGHTVLDQDFDPEYDFKSDEFDLIILNLNSTNDINIISHFRNDSEFDFIPIVCLIKKDCKDLNIEAYKLGCDKCFIKPVNIEELEIKINTLLKRYREICKSSISTILPHLMKNNPDLKLTNRERDLLYLVAKGLSNAEISKILYLSEMTVKTHLKNIFKKFNVSNRTEAILIGVANDIIKINYFLLLFCLGFLFQKVYF